jgi:hypothetical protein
MLTSRSTTAKRTTPRPGSSTTPLAIPRLKKQLPRWLARARSRLRQTGKVGTGTGLVYPRQVPLLPALRSHPRAAQPAIATDSPRSRRKVVALRPPCWSAARCAGCTDRTQGFLRTPQAARLHRQPPRCRASVRDTSTTSCLSAWYAPDSWGHSMLPVTEGLTSEALGSAQQKSLGFDRASPSEIRAEWLLEPGLKGFNLTGSRGHAAASTGLPSLV